MKHFFDLQGITWIFVCYSKPDSCKVCCLYIYTSMICHFPYALIFMSMLCTFLDRFICFYLPAFLLAIQLPFFNKLDLRPISNWFNDIMTPLHISTSWSRWWCWVFPAACADAGYSQHHVLMLDIPSIMCWCWVFPAACADAGYSQQDARVMTWENCDTRSGQKTEKHEIEQRGGSK